MVTANRLEDAINSGDVDRVLNGICLTCKGLGYNPEESCSCVEDPSEWAVKKLQEKAKNYSKKFHQDYQPRDEETLYDGHLDCLHFYNPKEEIGRIFIVESFEDVTNRVIRGGFIALFKQKLRKAFKSGKRLRRQKIGLAESAGVVASLALQEKRNINPDIEFGIITCYTYGNEQEGREETTDFECLPGKNWGRTLKLPPVVKYFDIEQITKEILQP